MIMQYTSAHFFINNTVTSYYHKQSLLSIMRGNNN